MMTKLKLQLIRKLRRSRNNFRATKLLKSRSAKGEKVKLHIGSGGLSIDQSWINIDLAPLEHVDLAINVLDGLPFPDQTVYMVFSEHFIEYLPKSGTKYFLREVHRILKPKGAHRILTPDLKGCVQVFLDNSWGQLEWTKPHKIETSADYLNQTMRLWGHQYIFDRETLEKFVIDAGYELVGWQDFGVSNFDEMKGIDTRVRSMILEATKPTE